MATDLLVWGVVAHLVADWILQTEWQALNKPNARHPAGYVHAGIHFLALSLVFGPWWALALALVHWLVDLRWLLAWWRKLIGQTTEGPMAPHVAIWGDQVVHVMAIAGAALLSGRG